MHWGSFDSMEHSLSCRYSLRVAVIDGRVVDGSCYTWISCCAWFSSTTISAQAEDSDIYSARILDNSLRRDVGATFGEGGLSESARSLIPENGNNL